MLDEDQAEISAAMDAAEIHWVAALRCNACGARWSPNALPAGPPHFLHGWWRCPNGCNADADGALDEFKWVAPEDYEPNDGTDDATAQQ